MSEADLECAIAEMVAKNLSPSQCEALLWLPADGSDRTIDKTTGLVDDGTLRLEGELHSLIKRRVTPNISASLSEGVEVDRLGERTWWRVTPLGLKVRALVEKGGAP